jgi:hypothetical protein
VRVGASCVGDAVCLDVEAFGLDSFLDEASYFDALTQDSAGHAPATNNSLGAYFGYAEAEAEAPHNLARFGASTANAVYCGG